MMIPEDKIAEVRTATDIIEVVSDYVQLRRRGQTFLGLCPFHQEKTPSFNVNPNMGIYKCFGCGKGGDVFNFVMEMEKSTFIEAVRTLAEKAQISLPEPDQSEDRQQDSIYESVYHALRFAARYFFDQLTQTDQGKQRALAYFQGRGFTPETIRKFGLGYSSDGWDGLLKAAEKAQIKVEYLEQAGLVLKSSKGGYYDRFRNRAMFPIFSHIGKVIGFGGRILTNEKDQPKYVNSPETIVYQKSHVLYGLSQSKQDIRGEGEAILVEGYTDVISLHQGGIRNVVASSGTALTVHQVRALSRYAKRVLMIYDADSAGANATLRGMNIIFEQGLSAEIIELPNGADPDSFVKQFGGEALRRYIREQRQHFIAFKMANAKKTGQWNTSEGKADTIREIIQTIAVIADPITQDVYVQEAMTILGVPEAHLRTLLTKMQQNRPTRFQHEQASVPPVEAPIQQNQSEKVETTTLKMPKLGLKALETEKMLLRLMLEQGLQMIEFVLNHTAFEEFSEGKAQTVVNLLIDMYQNGEVKRAAFLQGEFGEDIRDFVAELLMDQHAPSARWGDRFKGVQPVLNEDPYEVAADAMTNLKLFRIEQQIKEVQLAVFRTNQNEDEESALLSQLMQLQDFKKQIEKRAFLTTA